MNEVNLKLTVEEANTVLNALGNLPYGQVYQLVANIHQQASEQSEQLSREEPKAALVEEK